MTDSTPRLAVLPAARGCAQPQGVWTAVALAQKGVLPRLRKTLAQAAGRAGEWDLRGLAGFDHLGALVLWDGWGRQWPAALHASQAQRALLERVASQPALPPAAGGHASFAQRFDSLGQGVEGALAQVRGFVQIMGQLFLDALRLARAPQAGPWRDFSGSLYHIGAQALPITALVGFLIGVVLAYLMSQVLRQFGADAFIVDILGLALIRELGPLLAAVLIAGRSGSAITAQIGVMRVTEELDAMRVLGIAQGFRLVLPRALALAVAMPLLVVWTSLMALLGGMLAASLTGEPLRPVMAVSTAFGWFSLSSVLIGDALGQSWGTLALSVDLFRELVAILLMYVIGQRWPEIAIGTGGATTMDTTLPIVKQTCPPAALPLALVSGFFLTLLAPITMNLFLA